VANPIPPVSQWVPGFSSSGNYFGFFLAKGTPPEVLSTILKIFDEVIPTSPEFLNYAHVNGAHFEPVTGATAQAEAMKYISPAAWALYEAGIALYSPLIVGIPRPQD
jgi:hypothetical protein